MKSEKSFKINNIKAVIWDMDGVLVDSEDLHPVVESETARHFGMDFTPEVVRDLYLGVQLETEFNDMIKRSNRDDVNYEQMRIVRDNILTGYLKKGIKSVPHALEVLESLSDSYKLGLVSSGERFWGEDALSKLGLLLHFDVVIFGEDVKNHKPHPEPYLKAAEALGVSPFECLVVEDSESGFTSAKEAGMKVAVRVSDHNKNKDFSGADYKIKDLRQVLQILGRT